MTDSNKSSEKQLLDVMQKFKSGQDKQEAWREPQNPSDFQSICMQWAQYDLWKLKEGLNLLCRCRPEKHGWDYEIGELWKLAERSIGESLIVNNQDVSALTPGGKASKLEVRPNDLLEWADKKQIPIPCELENAVRSCNMATGTPPQIATQKRTEGKTKRLHALDDFFIEIQTRAKKINHIWDMTAIEVTKKDLMDVFYAINTNIKEVREDQFFTDLKNLGAKFKPGIKHNSDNILTVLFEDKLK